MVRVVMLGELRHQEVGWKVVCDGHIAQRRPQPLHLCVLHCLCQCWFVTVCSACLLRMLWIGLVLSQGCCMHPCMPCMGMHYAGRVQGDV